MTEISDHDLDVVVRTIYGEARNQDMQGMASVAFVIKNRTTDKRWPNTPAEVAQQKFQFSTWNPGDPNVNKINALPVSSLPYDGLEELVMAVWSGEISDPTQGSVFYYAYKSISPPKWWNKAVSESGGKKITVGDHVFTGKIRT